MSKHHWIGYARLRSHGCTNCFKVFLGVRTAIGSRHVRVTGFFEVQELKGAVALVVVRSNQDGWSWSWTRCVGERIVCGFLSKVVGDELLFPLERLHSNDIVQKSVDDDWLDDITNLVVIDPKKEANAQRWQSENN